MINLGYFIILVTICLLADFVIAYWLGFKSGQKAEGELWAEKKDYYEWLLQMRKRQDFEGVVEVPVEKVKQKKAKKIVKGYSLTCEYCGTPIKKGSVCPECKKAGW